MSFAPTGSIFNSAYMPALMIGITSGLKAMGALSAGNALVTSAARNQQAAEYQAQQLEINADQAKAAAQRDAHFKRLEGNLLISAIRARAGAGASDPSVLNVIAGAMERQAYNISASLYGGKDRARTMEMQADATRYQAEIGMADAKAGQRAYRFAAVGALAQGAASLYGKYWAQDKVSTGGLSGMAGLEAGADPDLDYGGY